MAALGTGLGRTGRGEMVLRRAVLLVVGAYLLLPLLAMLEFSTRGLGGTRSLAAWIWIGTSPNLVDAIVLQLQLAALTVALTLFLLLPTMVLVQLRLPWLRRVLEFLCLLPLTIPAIVLVVGLAPIYSAVTTIFGESALTLTFVYVVLALPFAHRAIAAGLSAIDLVTLAEAAHSLGCSWPGVVWRIVVPNIRGALIAAALVSVALVLGEFTISSLLAFDTLQVVINLQGKRNASGAVAVSVAALILAFVLLYFLSFVGRPARGSGSVREDP